MQMSNSAPIMAVFSLPFFCMEIPQVSIDSAEIFHMFMETAPQRLNTSLLVAEMGIVAVMLRPFLNQD